MATKRKSASRPESKALALSVDGQKYTLAIDDLGPSDARMLRKEAGMSIRQVFALTQEDADIDLVAAIVWLARRQGGEDITLDDVEKDITYSSKVEVHGGAVENDGESPEA